MFRENTSLMITGFLFAVIIAHSIYKKFGLGITLAMSYFFGNSVWNYVFHPSVMVRKNATTWLLESLVLFLFAKLLTDRKSLLKSAIVYYGILASIVSASAFYYFQTGYGLIDASSFESAMLIFAILIPRGYKLGELEKYVSFCLLVVALYIGGSTGLAIFACYLLGYVFNTSWTQLKVATAFFFIVGLVYAYKYTDLLNDSERFNIWSMYLSHWSSKFNMLIGSGIGTFKNISPHLPTAAGTLVYAHNDFLEILLETGVIGLIASAYLIFRLSVEAYKARLLHIVAMMCLFAVNYFPMQIMLTKMLFVLAIVTILNKAKAFKYES